ncbi:MAG: M64 family metallopeptidase, partial [Prevotella sp.]
SVSAQDFNSWFQDKTLRIDYIFSGNDHEQHIAVDELCQSPRWYGKRQHLAELPMEGNGQITVRDSVSGQVLYRNSFSTLFQEWQSYPEAKTIDKSFENVFLVPMPKRTVKVTLDLRNNRRQICASLTHVVNPKDILIRHIGEKGVNPYVYLQKAADTTRCIRVAYVAEGYTKAEMPKFLEDARRAMGYLFSYEPFKSSRNKFSLVAVESPSEDSGVSIPDEGIWKNTAVLSNFDTFYSARYLTTLHLKRLHDVLAGIPYEHIIVLVNTDRYGGGGILNSYELCAAHHPTFRPVVVHEFGHSFAGLADEYAYDTEEVPMYPHDVEPWEQNITTKADFKGKWSNLIGKDPKAGFYEGAGYSPKGVFRAYPDCRMRTNENPEFCPACKQAIQAVIDFYTK